MRFTYQDVPYIIYFKRGLSVSRHGEYGRSTDACIVYAKTRHEITRGVAKCLHSDQFNAETGRKLALKRALAGWPEQFRTAAWKAYHGRQGGVLWQKNIGLPAHS